MVGMKELKWPTEPTPKNILVQITFEKNLMESLFKIVQVITVANGEVRINALPLEWDV